MRSVFGCHDMILGGSRGQGLWSSFPGVPGLAPLVLQVVASLAWDILWRAVLAEGAADSASFGVIGCTEGCGGSGVFGWGCLSWGISDWRGWGFWLVASVGVVFAFRGFFGGVCFAALWSCGASLEAVLGHLKADDTLLNDISIVLQSRSNVKHY